MNGLGKKPKERIALMSAALVLTLCACHGSFGPASSAPDTSGRTPLQTAAAGGDIRSVTSLIEEGAALDSPTPQGNAPLHLAVRAGKLETVEALLRAGADVDSKAAGGFTPLHFACLPGEGAAAPEDDRLAIVEALIKSGANVNAQSDDGRTPLHVAALWREEKLAQRLLEAKASRSLKDSRGRTAAALARATGDAELVRVLEAK